MKSSAASPFPLQNINAKLVERTARLSVDVPASMLLRLKLEAIQRDATLKDLVVAILHSYLKEDS